MIISLYVFTLSVYLNHQSFFLYKYQCHQLKDILQTFDNLISIKTLHNPPFLVKFLMETNEIGHSPIRQTL